MATKPKNTPMCVVYIGHRPLLMTADKGMKVVALLSDALELDHDPEDYKKYIVDEPIAVRYESIRPENIRLSSPPPNEPVKPLLLGVRR